MSDSFGILLFWWWVLAGGSVIVGQIAWKGFFRPTYETGRYEAFIMLWVFVPLVCALGAVTYGLWEAL